MLTRELPSFVCNGRDRGFSLLELVIVLLLVSILAVFAAPRITSTQTILLPALADRLIANIRYTQSLSMSRGQRYRLNLTGNTYQITDMAGVAIVQPMTASTAAISTTPATLSNFNPPLVNSYVAFDGKGVPYVSATTSLASTASITLTSGTETATITIAPETGRVK